MKKLGSVSPYVFENFLLFSFNKEWLNCVKNRDLTLEGFIDNEKKIHLISKERIETP